MAKDTLDLFGRKRRRQAEAQQRHEEIIEAGKRAVARWEAEHPGWLIPVGYPDIWHCALCGTMVAEKHTDLHEKWHERNVERS